MAKVTLKYVGNFQELGYDDHPNAPSLHAARGKRATANRDKVVSYLRSATTYIVSPGRDEDIFEPRKSAGSASVMTDGVYVWPKTIGYYVETYDVELPADFEAHMERNRWSPPSPIDKLNLQLPKL
ncbi:MAG: hypothetical protein ABI704_10095 [Kofleriaceae bacterium]